MKGFLLLIIGYLGFVMSLQAQNFTYRRGVNARMVGFHFTIPDTSNNFIFENHPDIESMYVWFTDNRPELIYIGRGSVNDRSFYDLNFKGDVLTLESNYGPIHFITPKVSLNGLNGHEEFDFPTHWEIRAHIFKDSIVYSPEYRTGDDPHRPITGYAPSFLGHYEICGRKIADALRLENAAIVDSVIVLQGELGHEGKSSLTNLQLVVGEQSVFSDIAMRVMGDRQNKWYPATYVSGASGRSVNRFYIELNKDGSVTILPPKYMDAKHN